MQICWSFEFSQTYMKIYDKLFKIVYKIVNFSIVIFYILYCHLLYCTENLDLHFEVFKNFFQVGGW